MDEQLHLLASRLRECGHFLYYQTGGKAGQNRILVTLLRRGAISQKELQEILGLSSGALSEILQKMEEAALVERKKSSEDKRQVELALTNAGVCLAQTVRTHYVRTLERMFTCLDAGEKDSLEQILQKLVGHLDTLKTDPFFATNANPPPGETGR